MAQPIIYSTPPLAGRPPFATDEPDYIYDQHQPEQTRRLRQQPPADPNARTSAYNMYDQYIDEKGGNPFDDSQRVHPQPTLPLAAPQPGYAAPVAALNLSRPSPTATPDGRMPASPEMSEFGHGSASMPSTPHPLQPPMVPIAPVFARPSTATSRDVKFASKPIMRGDTEDTVLPRRGQRGDDFWRRFSMVAKEDMSTGAQKGSWWLRKTQNGTSRGWYVSHNNSSHNAPTAIGGSANEKAITTTSSTHVVAGALATSTVLHVSPTNTVAKREDNEPIPTPSAIYALAARGSSSHHVHVVQAHRHSRRTPLNRTTH
ncbi:hypothetical protein BC628DRAFT_856906 [Trametes gibbosa]|nr:hypothetical protein BC628DRAFT_856906 [Trametes gibbosa]